MEQINATSTARDTIENTLDNPHNDNNLSLEKSKKNSPNMKFITSKETLVEAISKVGGIVEKRNAIAVLSNILISTLSDGRVKITGTDMDIIAEIIFEAEIEQEGSLTVSVEVLRGIVEKLPSNAKISFATNLETGQVHLSSAKSNFKIPFLDADEFPILQNEKLDGGFFIKAKEFAEMIEKTKICMSVEETRYYLNGVYFHLDDEDDGKEGKKILKAVATDGHRLASSSFSSGDEIEFLAMPGVIVPKKAVVEISKILSKQEGDVKISSTEHRISFEFDNFCFNSKLIDGTFPDYTDVIPKGNPYRMVANVIQLRDAIDRVSTVSSAKTKSVKFTIEEEGSLVISSSSAGAGDGRDEIPVDFPQGSFASILSEGGKFDVGFNAKYLLDVLSVIKTENIEFFLKDETSPTLITAEGNKDDIFVIMPMRI